MIMMEFFSDVKVLRERAREGMCRGVNVGAEPLRTTFVLNQALALNMVCVLRHMRHFITAERLGARVVAQQFLEHTVRESEHADLIVARIRQLGGEPVYERDPMRSRGPLECDSSGEFEEVIRGDLIAERVAIAAYVEIVEWLSGGGPVSGEVLQRILSLEE